MNLEELKSNYKKARKKAIGVENLKKMTNSNHHPTLKKMKKQLVLESALWAVFLLVYYDFFDGHLKPFFWNLLLVLSIILLLVHNILGYRITMQPINGKTIKQSLANYLRKIKKYSAISVFTRVLAFASIMFFFFSTLPFGSVKIWIVFGLVLISAIQIYSLQKVWSVRIKKIRESLRGLES